MIDAKIQIIELTNKNGAPYKMLQIYVTAHTGVLIMIHEVFVRDSLDQILNALVLNQTETDAQTLSGEKTTKKQ
jgi:hypothetical protein